MCVACVYESSLWVQSEVHVRPLVFSVCGVRVCVSSLCSVVPKVCTLSCSVSFFFVLFLKPASVMQHLGVDEKLKTKKCALSSCEIGLGFGQ